MAVKCTICGKEEGLFGPSMFQCGSCGTVYCVNCVKGFKFKGFIHHPRNAVCPKCKSKGLEKI